MLHTKNKSNQVLSVKCPPLSPFSLLIYYHLFPYVFSSLFAFFVSQKNKSGQYIMRRKKKKIVATPIKWYWIHILIWNCFCYFVLLLPRNVVGKLTCEKLCAQSFANSFCRKRTDDLNQVCDLFLFKPKHFILFFANKSTTPWWFCRWGAR